MEVLGDKKDVAAKKLTDDDRNAFADADAEQMMMMLFKGGNHDRIYRCGQRDDHES